MLYATYLVWSVFETASSYPLAMRRLCCTVMRVCCCFSICQVYFQPGYHLYWIPTYCAGSKNKPPPPPIVTFLFSSFIPSFWYGGSCKVVVCYPGANHSAPVPFLNYNFTWPGKGRPSRIPFAQILGLYIYIAPPPFTDTIILYRTATHKLPR